MGWLSMLIEPTMCVFMTTSLELILILRHQLSTSPFNFVLYLACLVTINTLRNSRFSFFNLYLDFVR
jgi:hypothetical protein